MWTAGHMVAEAEPLRLKKKEKKYPKRGIHHYLGVEPTSSALLGGKKSKHKRHDREDSSGPTHLFLRGAGGGSLIVGAQQLNEETESDNRISDSMIYRTRRTGRWPGSPAWRQEWRGHPDHVTPRHPIMSHGVLLCNLVNYGDVSFHSAQTDQTRVVMRNKERLE